MATAVRNRESANKSKEEKKANVFHRRLGSLTFHQALQLLGDEGPKLIGEGQRFYEVQSDRDVFLGGDLFRVRVEDAELESGVAIATLTLNLGPRQAVRKRIAINAKCRARTGGAAIGFLLDAKCVLGWQCRQMNLCRLRI